MFFSTETLTLMPSYIISCAILVDNLLLLQMIPVAANDVAFSSHAVVLHLIIICQFAMFEVSIITSS